ncbi:MAG: RnfABCDGE type electron transport complex subunit B [Gammaproteobacteria bacterium]|nr:RnfABCDGE type electron transport complex subunit B [Gammaproteobacteria bacterium]
MRGPDPACRSSEVTRSGPNNPAGPGTARARVDAIDACLPQTQCTRCGYPSCRDYAHAMAAGESDINRCPPGGELLIDRLAALTGVAVKALAEELGGYQPQRVAVIDETWCIGCMLCVQRCPVDAIIGAPKRMHTVIESWCTGCELCLPPCPVDCIQMHTPRGGALDAQAWLREQAPLARARHQRRSARLAREQVQRRAAQRLPALGERRAYVAQAVARVRQRRAPLAAGQMRVSLARPPGLRREPTKPGLDRADEE